MAVQRCSSIANDEQDIVVLAIHVLAKIVNVIAIENFVEMASLP